VEGDLEDVDVGERVEETAREGFDPVREFEVVEGVCGSERVRRRGECWMRWVGWHRGAATVAGMISVA
jgi:hypothetical protein